MRAIASLGCEGVMRAIASSMSPHATSQQGPTPIFSAATADGTTTVQTVSAAAATLPTTPTRDAARVKGYCTDRAIFALLRCTTDELFFSCCGSVAARKAHAHEMHESPFEPQRESSFIKWVKAPPNTRRSRPGLSGDPFLCSTLYTVCGVGELYQRRSTLL